MSDKTIYDVKGMNDALAGWTIIQFTPCVRSESLFTIEATRDGVTKQINLFAIDTGWRAEPNSTDHTWLHFNFGGVKSSMCDYCQISSDHPQVAEPCKGTYQEWDIPDAT